MNINNGVIQVPPFLSIFFHFLLRDQQIHGKKIGKRIARNVTDKKQSSSESKSTVYFELCSFN